MCDITMHDSSLRNSNSIEKSRKQTTKMEPVKIWTDNHTKLTSFLQRLYPAWSEIFKGIADETILDEVILLVAYFFDCRAPCLFVHPISESGQAKLDCAQVGFGAQSGKVPLVINVYRKFFNTPKRERHLWCAENCVDYATVKKLDQAYKDLKCSIEGHIGSRIITGNSSETLVEKLYQLGKIALMQCPEAVHVHDGRPGLSYINVKSQDRIRFSLDSALALCPVPPKYILVLPKTGNHCTSYCDEYLVKSFANQNKAFEVELSHALSCVAVSIKVCECGLRLEKVLMLENGKRLNTLNRELSKHCGCTEDDVYVTPDPLTHSLVLFCPEKSIDVAKSVVVERVKVFKAECESTYTVIDFPDNDAIACISSGGCLLETDSQPSYERTLVLWVNSPQKRRKLTDEDLKEEYVKNTLLQSVDGVVAVQKFWDYPESALWGLVIMKDTMTCKQAIRDFNRPNGKYKLKWVNSMVNEAVLMFSVERKVKNKLWVKFSTDDDFERAKRFPWNEYWVVETYFFDNRQAKFVFKRNREDTYKIRLDISDLAGVSVDSVNHEAICPLRWSEEDLKYVEDTLEAKFREMTYMETYDMQFLSRKEGDTVWKGIVRFESYHKLIPQPFHGDTGHIQLKDDLMFLNNGVRIGMTLKVPRKVYYLFKGEIEKEEIEFHGCPGVHVSDVEKELVSLHFVWWEWSKMPDKLQDLFDLLKPVYIYGVGYGLANIMKNRYRPFQAVERWFQVAIVLASDSHGILIYGKLDHRTKAAEHVKTTLEKEHVVCKTIPLYGPSVPSGLITTLINKYGPDLDKLEIMSGCTVTNLDKKRHTIICRGRPTDIQTVKEELDNCCIELVGNAWSGLFTQIKECVACYCLIENPQNEDCHLSICGHTYCEECLVSQVKTQITQKLLPIACVAEDCETKLSVSDILMACSKGGIGTEEFLKVVLQHHLSRNRAICKPCPTPDCPMMYHLPVDDDKKFECGFCDKEFCMGCAQKWHAGLSCEIKKEIDNLEDEKLKTWILQRPKFRKMCPSCKSGIEKNGGCDNVHCASCSTSMCWRCLSFFKSSGECYDHIATKHKNEPADDQSDDELVDYDAD